MRKTTYTRPPSAPAKAPAGCGRQVTPSGAPFRLAWLHIPKTGTTFGHSLVQLVANASDCGNVSEATDVWEDPAWAKAHNLGRWLTEHYYWNKRVSFDGHDDISPGVWQLYRGAFAGFFRSPAARAHSAYHHFPTPLHYPGCTAIVSEREYAERVRGTMTMMISGQASGYACMRARAHTPPQPSCALVLARSLSLLSDHRLPFAPPPRS